MKRRPRVQARPVIPPKESAGRQNSEPVCSTDQNLKEPNVNRVSGCQADAVSVSDATASQFPQSVTVPQLEMSEGCDLNEQKLDVVKQESVPSEKSVYRQLIDECKESCETGSSEGNGPPQKRRRFVRKQPNVVKNVQSCVSASVSTSSSSIESPAEAASLVPPLTVESASPAALGDVKSGDSPVKSVVSDAADDCKVPSVSTSSSSIESPAEAASPVPPLTVESASPTKSEDGPESCHSMDTVDLGGSSLPVPMSPQVLSPKVRHHFTKMRPNLTNCLTSKHNSTAPDRLPKANASTVDDEPFIPPPIIVLRSAACGLDEGVAMEESVVVLPETVEKAAAKLIARKLKLKKKKRAMENLDAPIDSSKVCMRDLIYMNPVNNPMKSNVAESVSNDSVKSSVTLKKSLTSAPAASPAPIIEKVAAPQLKIGPDGSIIINEASLVIERQPMPSFDGTEAIEETDNMRCGYPKRGRTKSWSKKETRKFFAALSMIGTDFFLMMNLFPGRTRAELKRKFKREEKVHQAMVETALSDRRSLDMSLMAVHSSDEEEEVKKPKGKQLGKRGPRGANKKPPADVSGDKGKLLEGKENDPQPVAVVKKEKKRKQEKEKQPVGNKRKKKKSRYYEESSDEAEGETEERFESGSHDAESVAEEEEDDHRTIAKVPSPHLSDEDEVEIVSCVSRRPTRSGRVPKPVKTYNPVRFSDLEASAAAPAIRQQPLSAKRKPEPLKLQATAPSPARTAGLMSPPPFRSPTRVPCSSPRAMCSPLPFMGSPPPCGSPAHAPILSPLVSCSPSSQLSLLAANIPGLENVPPGKQLMIVASPVMSGGDGGEPPQQMLHVFMVSSPVSSSDTCNDGEGPTPMESTPNRNSLPPPPPADPGLVAHSANNRTRERCTSSGDIANSASQSENSASSSTALTGNIRTVANKKTFNASQVSSDSSVFIPSWYRTPASSRSNLDSLKSESFGTDTSMVSLGSKLEETLVSTLFSGRRQNDSANLDGTHGTNGSVSPMLSTSALEYCISQVTNAAPASLRFSETTFDHDSVGEDDIELEGNITNVLQQDDGTTVIIAESANVISNNGVPETPPSTDPGPDVKSMDSVEVSLEKDSENRGGSAEKIPLKEDNNPEAIDVKVEFIKGENVDEDVGEFIEVFIEMIPDLVSTLGTGTLSGTETTARDAGIMSHATDDKSITAAAVELSDKVECQRLAEKCVSGDFDAVEISESSGPNRYSPRSECAAVLSATENISSTDVNINLGTLDAASNGTTDIDVSSGTLNNNTNNSRVFNAVTLPDGSFEIVLDNEAWSSEGGPDQDRYLDIEFPDLDEQAWIDCDIIEF